MKADDDGGEMADLPKRRMTRIDRRAQLLSVAGEMVREDGLRALTMAGLAERAAVAKPVVYTHFASSAHVAIALMDEQFKAIKKHFDERVSTGRTIAQYVTAVADSAFDFVVRIPILKITNGFSAGDEINAAYLRHVDDFRMQFECLLEVAGAPGHRIAVASAVLATMFGSAINAGRPDNSDGARTTLILLLTAAIDALALEAGNPDVSRKSFDRPIAEMVDSVLARKLAERKDQKIPMSAG